MERFGRQRPRQYPQHRDARREGDRDLDFAFAKRPRASSWKDTCWARHNAHVYAQSAQLCTARPHQIYPGRLSSTPAPWTSWGRDLPTSADSYTSWAQGERALSYYFWTNFAETLLLACFAITGLQRLVDVSDGLCKFDLPPGVHVSCYTPVAYVHELRRAGNLVII